MKTKTRFNKLTAWLLTLAMLMTLVPGMTFTAFAAAGDVASVTTEGGVTSTYTDISSAINAAMQNSGSTLTLLDNIDMGSNCVTINGGKFTIDLGGKTWQGSDDLIWLSGTETNITITDSSTDKTGKLLSTYHTKVIFLWDTAVLTLHSGTIEGGNEVVSLRHVNNNSTELSQAQFVMHGGTVKSNSVVAIDSNGKSVTISGGTIDGEIGYSAGEIDLSGHSDPSGILIYTSASTPSQVGIRIFLRSCPPRM